MKRIVTFVVPNESGRELSAAPPPLADTRQILNELPTGTFAIEVVVDDSGARRICDAIMSTKPRDAADNDDEPGRTSDDSDSNQNLDSRIDSIVRDLAFTSMPAPGVLEQIVSEVERQLITRVYSECKCVKSHAALRLGINRNTLVRKLRQYGLSPV